MSFNGDTFSLMLKFGGGMLGILLLVWLLAIATPHIAKFVDKLTAKLPARVQNSQSQIDNNNDYKVHDIYEGEKNIDDNVNDKNKKE